MAKAKRESELVPCFDKFEGMKEMDGVVVARSSSGGVIREGRMLKRCFMPMIAAGLALLVQIGWMPVMTKYHGMRRHEDGTIEFDIEGGGLRITARVTQNVARSGHRDLSDLLPPENVVKLRA